MSPVEVFTIETRFLITKTHTLEIALGWYLITHISIYRKPMHAHFVFDCLL